MALQEYKPGQELSSIDFQGMIGGPLSAIVDAQAQAALSSVNFIKSVGFTPDTEDESGNLVAGSPVYVSFKYPKVVAPYQPGTLGTLESVSITDGGKDYVDGEAVTIEGGGTGATAVIGVNTNGKITSITISNAGNGYTKDAPVTINASSGTGFVGKINAVKDIKGTPAVIEQMELEVPILTMLPIPFIRVEEAEIDFHAKITSMSYANVASNFKVTTENSFTSSNSGRSSGGGGLDLGIISFGAKSHHRYTNTVSLKTNLSYQSTSRAGNKIDKVFQLGVKVKVSQDEMPEGMEKLMGILEDSIISKPVEV
jgi:hypothetical protein